MRIRSIQCFAVLVLGAGSAALAQPVNMNVLIETEGSSTWNWQLAGRPGTWAQDAINPDQWTLTGRVDTQNFGLNLDGLQLDPDPFISNAYTLTNNTGVTQTYNVTVTLPVIPLPAFTQTFGSVAGSLGDTNFNASATVSTDGASPIYTALIDGATYQTLLDSPFSLSTPAIAGFTLGFPNPPAFFNFPNGQPGVATTIGINNRFTLSPGDSVSLVSTFRIDPEVPAPGLVSLFALGGLVATRRRR